MAIRSRIAATLMTLSLVLVYSPQLASADTILHYTGKNFTQFPCYFIQCESPFFFPGDFVTATVDLLGPLPSSQSLYYVSPVSWSFTAGAVSMTNTTPFLDETTFEFSTDATGTIVGWNIGLVSADLCGYGIFSRFVGNASIPFYNSDYAYMWTTRCLMGTGPDYYAAENFNSPGAWTIPEPNSLCLVVAGLMGSAFWLRKRFSENAQP